MISSACVSQGLQTVASNGVRMHGGMMGFDLITRARRRAGRRGAARH